MVLDNPRNLGNAGAVIRLAAGFGATGVVTTGTLDPWHPTVVRGGAGLHFATVVERLTVAELPPGPVFALDPEGDDIRGMKLPDDAVLAFGSERTGCRPNYARVPVIWWRCRCAPRSPATTWRRVWR